MFQILVEIDAVTKELDLTDVAPIDLNFQISDISDISSKNSSYTKTIVLPATHKNRNIFKNISDTSSDLGYYTFMNPNKRIRCWILKDTIPVLNGYLQLKTIKITPDTKSIEVVVYSLNEDIFSKLGDKMISEVDVSGLNHIYSKDNIISSWNNELGYYYPLIDYGNGWSAGNVLGGPFARQREVENFAPSISAAFLFRKIFNEAGYTISGSFLNSDIFKNCVIPSTKKLVTDDSMVLTSKQFYVGKLGLQQINYPYSYPGVQVSGALSFDDETTAPYSDPNGFISSTFYTHSGGTVKQRFTIGIQCAASNAYNEPFNDDLHVSFYRQFDPTTGLQSSSWNAGEGYPIPFNSYINPDTAGAVLICQHDTENSALSSEQFVKKQIVLGSPYNLLPRQGIEFQYSTDYLDYRSSDKRWKPLADGEKVRIKVNYRPYSTINGNPGPLVFTKNCYWYNEISKDIIQDQEMPMKAMIPKNIKCKDYIMAFVNMFNLYLEQDKENEKHVIIDTKDDFYSSGKLNDWTNRVDTSQEIQVNVLGESQPKKVAFSWKEDKDYYNKFFKDFTNDNYGNVVYNIDNDFTTTEKKMEVIFSPTPLVRLAHPDQNININIPVIVEKVQEGQSRPSGAIETNIRLLLRNKVDMLNSTTFAFEDSEYSYYPYAGHLNHPYSPTFDLNFGVPSMTYFPIVNPAFNYLFVYPFNNLTWKYWNSYLKEVSDPNSKIIKCTMRLSSYDIGSFTFRDRFYINTLSTTGLNAAEYRLNKIEGWDGTKAKVELIKISNK